MLDRLNEALGEDLPRTADHPLSPDDKNPSVKLGEVRDGSIARLLGAFGWALGL